MNITDMRVVEALYIHWESRGCTALAHSHLGSLASMKGWAGPGWNPPSHSGSRLAACRPISPVANGRPRKVARWWQQTPDKGFRRL